MSVTITEQDLYKQIRALIEIRTKVQLLEREFMYMPLGDISKALEKISAYNSRLSALHFAMSQVIIDLNNFLGQDKLF